MIPSKLEVDEIINWFFYFNSLEIWNSQIKKSRKKCAGELE